MNGSVTFILSTPQPLELLNSIFEHLEMGRLGVVLFYSGHVVIETFPLAFLCISI